MLCSSQICLIIITDYQGMKHRDSTQPKRKMEFYQEILPLDLIGELIKLFPSGIWLQLNKQVNVLAHKMLPERIISHLFGKTVLNKNTIILCKLLQAGRVSSLLLEDQTII